MRNFLNHFFGFNKQQRNGLLVLLTISLLLLVVRISYPHFMRPGNVVLLELPLISKKIDSAEKQYASVAKFDKKKEERRSALFVFDPNTVSKEQLLRLGLKPKNADVFLKFRNRGFVFRNKEDLHKVYGISDKLYKQLEPYILIVEKNPENNIEIKTVKEKRSVTSPVNIHVVELNSADSTDLLQLDGIGDTYAKRILKYRNILGGFSSIEQLKEVYGFNDELFEKTKNSLTIDKSKIHKLDLNKDDFKVINKHPYFTYELTKSIFNWRRKTIITAENLKDILGNTTLYQKLLPYLNFGQMSKS